MKFSQLQLHHFTIFTIFYNSGFSARLGCGATLNDKKISVKKANKLKDSLILTGSSASRNQERADKIFGNMQEVVMNPCLGNFGEKLWSL